MILNDRSEKSLVGVNPDLVRVVRRAAEITTVDFVVTEGIRTIERQKALVAKGASRTMQSKHLVGRAVDLAPVIDGVVRWDWPPFHNIADAMKAAALELGVPVIWGGTWRPLAELPDAVTNAVLSKSFPDGPHFELP